MTITKEQLDAAVAARDEKETTHASSSRRRAQTEARPRKTSATPSSRSSEKVVKAMLDALAEGEKKAQTRRNRWRDIDALAGPERYCPRSATRCSIRGNARRRKARLDRIRRRRKGEKVFASRFLSGIASADSDCRFVQRARGASEFAEGGTISAEASRKKRRNYRTKARAEGRSDDDHASRLRSQQDSRAA